MKTHAFRLNPGQDLYRSLEGLAASLPLSAGVLLTCVGSLSEARIRPAARTEPQVRTEAFEILSLVGTLSPDGLHVHISLGDGEGRVWGGHLLPGCVVRTTAEIVIGELEGISFSRALDPQTGFRELRIEGKGRGEP